MLIVIIDNVLRASADQDHLSKRLDNVELFTVIVYVTSTPEYFHGRTDTATGGKCYALRFVY